MDLLRLRKLKGWTQEELGQKIGEKLGQSPITRQAVNKYESGAVLLPVKYLLVVSDLLDTSPNELMGFRGNTEKMYMERVKHLEDELEKAKHELIVYKEYVDVARKLLKDGPQMP